MALAWPDKDPGEVLDYPLEWDAWLVQGATLSAVGGDCTVVLEGVSSPGGLTNLTIDLVQVASPDVVTWLSGGSVGETYTLLATVKDNQTPKRTGVRRIKISITKK